MLDLLNLLDTAEEKDAFKKIYELYSQKLYYTAFGILKDSMSAEDMVHETFLSLTKNMDKITDIECHKTWVYIVTILKNHCFNLLKKQKRVIQSDLADDNTWEANEKNPEEFYIDQEKLEIIRNLISQLQYPYKEVLYLQYYNEMTSQQIGEALNLKAANVRQISKRARAILKKRYMRKAL